MRFFTRSNREDNLSALVEEISNTTDTNRYATLFIELIAFIRPARRQPVAEQMQQLLQALRLTTNVCLFV
jgi:site-specific recombinase